jgi:phosphoribosyl-dephospho-CoA transferase
MIKPDLYMKVVLTIIAISLSIIAMHNMGAIKKAEASGTVTDVVVTNLYEIVDAISYANKNDAKEIADLMTNDTTYGVHVVNAYEMACNCAYR